MDGQFTCVRPLLLSVTKRRAVKKQSKKSEVHG